MKPKKSQFIIAILMAAMLSTLAAAQVVIDQFELIKTTQGDKEYEGIGRFSEEVVKSRIVRIYAIKLETGERQRYAKDTNNNEITPTFFPDDVNNPDIKVGQFFLSFPKMATGEYMVFVVLSKGEDGKPVPAMSKPFKVPEENDQTPLPTTPPVIKGKRGESNARNDSDVYIAGEIVLAEGAKPIYTLDVKVEPNLRAMVPDWDPEHRWDKWIINPVIFSLKASANKPADPDSLEFGFRAKRIFAFASEEERTNPFRPGGFESMQASSGAKLEMTKDFKNSNFIMEGRLKGVQDTRRPFGRRSAFNLNPYIGVEGGTTIVNEVKEASDKALLRLLAGVESQLYVPLPKGIAKNIVWETNFVRRWPLTKEVEYDRLGVLEGFGKGPRNYLESKFVFNLDSFVSPYIGIEWGQLPPNFKLVDRMTKIGFIYKFKFLTPN